MIGIDIRFMSENMKNGTISSGVGLFCADVLKGIVQCKRSAEVVLIADSNQFRAAQALFSEYSICKYNRLPRGRLSYVLNSLEEKRFNTFLSNEKINMIWYPFATPYYFVISKVFTISTIHDLIPVHESLSPSIKKESYRSVIKNSGGVITISNYVKRDIEDLFPEINKSKIISIPNPVSIDFSSNRSIPELSGKEYILDLNAFQERKNIETLVFAYANSELIRKCDLVFCGGYNEDSYLERMKELVADLGLESRVHFYLALPIEQRNWLINNTKMLVSPSVSEGFGRTPVEAMIACKPVIISSLPVFLEATKGLAFYYGDAKDKESLREKMEYVFNNPPSTVQLNAISSKISDCYSSLRIAKQYLSLFDLWGARDGKE